MATYRTIKAFNTGDFVQDFSGEVSVVRQCVHDNPYYAYMAYEVDDLTRQGIAITEPLPIAGDVSTHALSCCH